MAQNFVKMESNNSTDNKTLIPSDYCIECNSFNLARYAKIVQEHEMVPIVEPEIIMDGEHSIQDCYDVTTKN